MYSSNVSRILYLLKPKNTVHWPELLKQMLKTALTTKHGYGPQ